MKGLHVLRFLTLMVPLFFSSGSTLAATSAGQMNAVAEDGNMEAIRKHFEVALKVRTFWHTEASLGLAPPGALLLDMCGHHGELSWFFVLQLRNSSVV